MDHDTAVRQLLDSAERLFYGKGIQAVGMDEIRADSGVSLKRLYQLFPTKEQLVIAYLDRRDVRWHARLAEHVDLASTADGRILAVFDWLESWFGEPDFRGCAWINCYGELGTVWPGIAEKAREHKSRFRAYLQDLVKAAARPAFLADHLLLLAEGAMTTAAINQSTKPAAQAKKAAGLLLKATAAA